MSSNTSDIFLLMVAIYTGDKVEPKHVQGGNGSGPESSGIVLRHYTTGQNHQPLLEGRGYHGQYSYGCAQTIHVHACDDY